VGTARLGIIGLMPHLHRFHVNPDSSASREIALSPEEAHHARRVVRLRDGVPVECFDGAGGLWRGLFQSRGPKDAVVEVESYRLEPPPSTRVTIAQAWLHRPKAVEELLRRGTEVGVSRFVFFEAERSVRAPKSSDKWERILVEVCKQCGRNWLPVVDLRGTLRDVLGEAAGTFLWCGMEATTPPDALPPMAGPATLAVGPEGDFTEAEVALLRESGGTPVSLGDYTYRSEVAAVLGATLLLARAGAFRPGKR